ncbi:MAG: DUF3124 domain-containing protein [Lewinellaceae bacterium]|nr:DUF3124 domain-containing protein [Saprospiraceae bacterium]MCB9341015.1 DUF3124 domain-containing protein [Lewinellaceae bacterium]
MNNLLLTSIFCLGIFACNQSQELSSLDPENWEKRAISLPATDSLIDGKTYLSVYSQIYSYTEHRTHDLTATISMRNISDMDTVYVLSAKYYDTRGHLIRTYFDKPIYLAPLETVEIVIDSDDDTGGTGANFIFGWASRPGRPEPYFEGVMITTLGSQGLSFTTQGKRVR